MSPDRPARSGGLRGSLGRLAHSLLEVLQTRLEILSTEIAEERLGLARAALVTLGALFCFQLGMTLAVLFFVLAVGSEHRLAAVGIAAVVVLLGAVAGVLWLRHWLKTRPPFLGTTIAELRKDRERLKGKS